jgi:hypothetical protein
MALRLRLSRICLRLFTGYPLGHAGQAIFGQLPAGQRLIPKTPFVLGGQFRVDNLIALEAVEGMNLRSDIWRQIKDLPDGAQIELRSL